jgi:hypothetical protein
VRRKFLSSGCHSGLDQACPGLDPGESILFFWIPAFAGMTKADWIPAFAGMTKADWIPAFAGMTFNKSI